MSKFLLNLLLQISKAFVYSKIQILFGNNSSQISAHLAFRPSRGPFFFFFQPAAPPLPTGPQPLGRPSRPARRWRLTRLPSSSRGSASSRAAFTLSSRRLTGGPHLSSLTSGPPELGRAATTSRRSPRRPAPPRMPSEPLPPCHHFPLLNPPLNLTPVFNGINAINVAVTPPRPPLSGAPLGPYKRVMRPSALTARHPLPSKLFRALLHHHDELKPPPFVASGVPPLRHPSVTGEHLPSTASTGSFFPSVTSEQRRAPAPARRASVRRRRALCPRSTVDPCCPWSAAPWTRSTEFFVVNLIRKSVISGILQRGPSVSLKLTRSP
jgi:hypothetical protein